MTIILFIKTYSGVLFLNFTGYHKTPFYSFHGNLSTPDKFFLKKGVGLQPRIRKLTRRGSDKHKAIAVLEGSDFHPLHCPKSQNPNSHLHSKISGIRPLILPLKTYIVMIVYGDRRRVVNNDVRDKKSFSTSGQPFHYVT